MSFSHITLASSEWAQLCVPAGVKLGQSKRLDSVPVQSRSSSTIAPVPCPCEATRSACKALG